MSDQIQKQNSKNVYDLEERTILFSERILVFVKTIDKNLENRNIISQLIRSATSVGANYCEADGAESKKDFVHKISLCKKECKETKYWLRLLAIPNPECKAECRGFWREAQELTLIFSKIIINSNNKDK